MANTWGGAREGAGRRPDFHRADERERHGASRPRPPNRRELPGGSGRNLAGSAHRDPATAVTPRGTGPYG